MFRLPLGYLRNKQLLGTSSSSLSDTINDEGKYFARWNDAWPTSVKRLASVSPPSTIFFHWRALIHLRLGRTQSSYYLFTKTQNLTGRRSEISGIGAKDLLSSSQSTHVLYPTLFLFCFLIEIFDTFFILLSCGWSSSGARAGRWETDASVFIRLIRRPAKNASALQNLLLNGLFLGRGEDCFGTPFESFKADPVSPWRQNFPNSSDGNELLPDFMASSIWSPSLLLFLCLVLVFPRLFMRRARYSWSIRLLSPSPVSSVTPLVVHRGKWFNIARVNPEKVGDQIMWQLETFVALSEELKKLINKRLGLTAERILSV